MAEDRDVASTRLVWLQQAGRRELLTRALGLVTGGVAIPSQLFGLRADRMKLESLPVGVLGRGSPVPLELVVARTSIPLVYVCPTFLVVAHGDELLLAVPPGDDASLPAYRCPPLDGSWVSPERSSLDAHSTGGAACSADVQRSPGLQPVALGPRVHAMLRACRAGPALDEREREQLLALMFVLRWWQGVNSEDLRLPVVFSSYDEVPAGIREDLGRAGEGHEVVRFEPADEYGSGVEITCHPGRLQVIEDGAREDERWIEGYVLERRAHDSQSGGGTARLWHCGLGVTDGGWTLQRELLWTRVDEGVELS